MTNERSIDELVDEFNAKAKTEGKYKGRVEDVARNAGIASMLKSGQSYSAIQAAMGCSRATIAKIAKRQARAA